MSTNIALAGYLKLLRSSKKVFGKDIYAFNQSKEKLRYEFLKNKNVTDKKQLNELYNGIIEADEVLRFNIIQGHLNDKGRYSVSLTEPNHAITLESGQCETHGPALEPIDLALLGDVTNVSVEHVVNNNNNNNNNNRKNDIKNLMDNI